MLSLGYLSCLTKSITGVLLRRRWVQRRRLVMEAGSEKESEDGDAALLALRMEGGA